MLAIAFHEPMPQVWAAIGLLPDIRGKRNVSSLIASVQQRSFVSGRRSHLESFDPLGMMSIFISKWTLWQPRQ